jgi:hypothetical protein
MWLNTFILAVIEIIAFLLIIFPRCSVYYTIPMGIIGKVYANSMLVQINSRMVLGSEETETPSTVISILRFHMALANPRDSATAAYNGDVGVDIRAGAGPAGSAEVEGL